MEVISNENVALFQGIGCWIWQAKYSKEIYVFCEHIRPALPESKNLKIGLKLTGSRLISAGSQLIFKIFKASPYYFGNKFRKLA